MRKPKARYKNKQHRPEYIYFRFTDDDLIVYSPEFCSSLDRALKEFNDDIVFMAKQDGYKKSEIWASGINETIERIKALWEN